MVSHLRDTGMNVKGEDSDLVEAFLALRGRADVARFLEISEKRLCSVLYGSRERTKYLEFSIPKKGGGFRIISAPPPTLKYFQKRLVPVLSALNVPKPASHGFHIGRSIVTNAERHLAKQFVLNVDLKNFFPSIHIGRFIALLKAAPFKLGKEAATTIAQLCFKDDGTLPQGGPASPAISNLICRQLDEHLQQLASKCHCHYTRYADDLTFSTSRRTFPPTLGTYDPRSHTFVVGDELVEVIEAHNFTINIAKVRLQTSRKRQEVTGLSVNEIPNVRRRFVRELNSIAQCWRQHGYEQAYMKYLQVRKLSSQRLIARPEGLITTIWGKLAFLEMVKGSDDPVFRRVRWTFHDLSDGRIPPPVSIANLKPAPLHGIKGRFRGWPKMVRRLMQSVCHIQILEGDDVVAGATGFIVGPNTMVTAGHVADAGPLRIGFERDGLQPIDKIVFNVPGGRDFAVLSFAGRPFESFEYFRTQLRLPEIGEEVAALGYPRVPQRDTTLVLHRGTIEALPVGLRGDRFLQTSFQSGGGLSGSPLLDRRGYVIGVMIENVFLGGDATPPRPYGQAMPFEYVVRVRAPRWMCRSVTAATPRSCDDGTPAHS